MAVGINEEGKWGYYLVGLLDILGQKSGLEKIKNIPQDPTELAAQKEKGGNIFKPVKSLREGFELFYKAYSDPSRRKDFSAQVDKETLKNLRKVDIRFQHFSDTLVFYVFLGESKEGYGINGVYGSLAGASNAFITLMGTGHFIRGGIDVGPAADFFPNEIYGPCLNEVYWLEQEIAQSPRILIGDGLIKYISSIKGLKGSIDLVEKVSAKTAGLCQNYISTDHDGNFILDYLGGTASLKKKPDIKGLIETGIQNSFNELKRFYMEGNKKLSSRYTIHCNYLSRCAKDWDISLHGRD